MGRRFVSALRRLRGLLYLLRHKDELDAMRELFPDLADELEGLRVLTRSQDLELEHLRPRAQVAEDLVEANDYLQHRIEEVLELGRIDGRTGLQNQDEWQKVKERLSKAYPEDRRRREDIVYLDMDYFKRLNDLLGHDHGDTILEEMGRLMLEEFAHNAFRCGNGDEMAGLTPHGEGEAAVARLRAAWPDQSYTFTDPAAGGTFVVRPSFGVGKSPLEAEQAMRADKAAHGALGDRD